MKKTLLFSGLLGLSALMLPARSPGGFDDGVDVWFRTAPVSSNLQGRYHWFDFAGDFTIPVCVQPHRRDLRFHAGQEPAQVSQFQSGD